MRSQISLGLPPCAGARTAILILGSFPGTRSLELERYYSHPQNRFWPAMHAAVGVDPGAPYEARISALNRAGIGLWDVLSACERHGSLDQAIVRGTEVPSDLGALVESIPSLRAILLNGKSVATLFDRHQVPRAYWGDLGVAIEVLPSTSPANASVRRVDLVAAWAGAIARHSTAAG